MKSIIFQEKYGVDPSTLTLQEIDAIIFKGRKPIVSFAPIWEMKSYDADKILKEAIKGL
jgi:hypothetical protein